MNERSFIVKWPLVLRGNSHFNVILGRGADRIQWQRVGLLGKLPNRSYRANREKCIQRGFQNVPAFFF